MIVLPVQSIDIPCRVQAAPSVLEASMLGRIPAKLSRDALFVRCAGSEEVMLVTKPTPVDVGCRFFEYGIEETASGWSYAEGRPAAVYATRTGDACPQIDFRDRLYPGTRWTHVFRDVPPHIVFRIRSITAADGRKFLRGLILKNSKEDLVYRHPVENTTVFPAVLSDCFPRRAPPTSQFIACYGSAVKHPHLDGTTLYFGVSPSGEVHLAQYQKVIY